MKDDDEEGNRKKRLMNKRQWTAEPWTEDPFNDNPFDYKPIFTYRPIFTYIGGYRGLALAVALTNEIQENPTNSK